MLGRELGEGQQLLGLDESMRPEARERLPLSRLRRPRGGAQLLALVGLVIGFVERPGKPLLRNFSGPRTPFWTRLDLRAAQLKDLDLLLIKPGLGSWPAQMVKG